MILTRITISSGSSKSCGFPSKLDKTNGKTSKRPRLPFHPRDSQNWKKKLIVTQAAIYSVENFLKAEHFYKYYFWKSSAVLMYLIETHGIVS